MERRACMGTQNQEKVGVYICHCGTNIAGTVDVEEREVLAVANLMDR